MNKKVSSALKYILMLLLAAALLWLAFRKTDWKEFFDGLKATDWGCVALSLAAAVAALVFRAERWRLQLIQLDPEISRWSIWHGSNVGNFLNIVIPGTGEFVRCGEVSTKKAGYDRTFGSIVMERAWDVLAILVLFFVALLGSRESLAPFMREHVLEPLASRFSFSFGLVAAAVVLVLAVALVLLPAFRNKSRFCRRCVDAARGILQGFSAFGKMKGKLLFLVYTVGIWVMYIFMTWFTFLALPELSFLTFSDAVFISAVGNLASVIPTPGNLGAYHYLVGMAISTVYLGSVEIMASALLFATLSHGVHALLLIVLGIISYALIQKKFLYLQSRAQ